MTRGEVNNDIETLTLEHWPKDVLEAKVAEGVIRYIEMKEGGHFQYGMSFIASQVISRF